MRFAGLFAVITIFLALSSLVFTPSSEAAEGKVTRTPSTTTAAAGEEITIDIKPTGFGGFYAVKENLGGLILVSNTADNFDDDTFIMIVGKKFQYVVKIPENAKPCDKFEITGMWWPDPTDKSPVNPNPSIIEVTCDPTVVIEAKDDSAVTPSGMSKTIDVTANDKGHNLKVINVTDPPNGTTAIVSDHAVSYKSEPGFVGSDTFKYTIKDSKGETDTATVTVTVTETPPGTAPFKLLPSSSEQPIGKKFTVQIWTNASSSQEIAGVEVYLSFDPTRLQVVDWDPTQTGVQIKPVSSSLNTLVKNETDNKTGEIDFASGTLIAPYPTGAFLVAEITFRGIEVSPQPTDIEFSFESGRFTTASVFGIAIPGQPENASVVLTDVKLVGIVQLEGGARPEAEGWVVPITVKFFEPGMDTPIDTCNTSTTKVAEGARFECSAVSGVFDITVDSFHVLANIKRRVELPVSGGSNIVNFGTLLEGDANDDGIVNVTDFTVLSEAFGNCDGGQNFNPSVDFDRNKCVNILDFTLLSKNFLKMEPITVP